MNVKINAVKFKIDEKLEEFIIKKVSKFEKQIPTIVSADVILKIDKPESENNKIAEVRLLVTGYDLFASKQADTFEQAIMLCIDALKTQIDKHKEKF
ncbi:MAG: ribosome-associated translation inhibitor RaiA [Bacteroidales bacterium]|jgi:putative sigma-54 modulation protein|nr:ribosome-associated translation inhibitor RaiA [Bacteroidales bacterium]